MIAEPLIINLVAVAPRCEIGDAQAFLGGEEDRSHLIGNKMISSDVAKAGFGAEEDKHGRDGPSLHVDRYRKACSVHLRTQGGRVHSHAYVRGTYVVFVG